MGMSMMAIGIRVYRKAKVSINIKTAIFTQAVGYMARNLDKGF